MRLNTQTEAAPSDYGAENKDLSPNIFSNFCGHLACSPRRYPRLLFNRPREILVVVCMDRNRCCRRIRLGVHNENVTKEQSKTAVFERRA